MGSVMSKEEEYASCVVQVFGANTDVGKTVVSTGLLRAAAMAAPFRRLTYIKPLQTGQVHDGDFVRRYAAPATQDITVHCHTLFSWRTPVSPHLAAAKEGSTVTGEEIVAKLQAQLAQNAAEGGGITVVETAGGVLSPGPSSARQAQADLYRPLRLPVLLVGDGRLGGISCTLSAYESLHSRGYDVQAVAILDSADRLNNAAAVHTYIAETLGHVAVPVVCLPSLPSSTEKEEEDAGATCPLEAWYGAHLEAFAELLRVLETRERARLHRLQSMPQRASEVFWYPFTQHQGLESTQLHVVDSAHGDHYTILDKKDVHTSSRLIDACASWWTQGLGHGRADVALAVGAAAGRYGHVIFPGNVHEPALRLAELMLEGPGQGWATRVFFSDNGSTAMEIAVKMALKQALSAGGQGAGEEAKVQLAVVTQQDCYHGDTLGCMDAAAPTVFNTGQHPWYEPRTLSLAVPTLGWVQGQLQVEVPAEIQAVGATSSTGGVLPFPKGMAALLDLPARAASPAATLYRQSIRTQMDAFEASGTRKLGAVLLEPVLMGAAGMLLVDPLFQRILVEEGRARGLPIVFDEVASGLHRLGCASTCELLGIAPDIACYGKTLTGGYLPLALTLSTEAVFQAFHGPAKSDALLHGHSYTANPLACAAAVRALEAYAAMDLQRGNRTTTSVHPEAAVAALSCIPGVRRAVALGTVLAVELAEGEGEAGYGSMASAQVVADLKDVGVYARPLGNVVYLLASQVASVPTTQTLLKALDQVLRHRAGSDTVKTRSGGGGGGVVI